MFSLRCRLDSFRDILKLPQSQLEILNKSIQIRFHYKINSPVVCHSQRDSLISTATMKGVIDQVWLTCVLDEQDVRNSVVLCSSLRKVLTNRQVAVLASPKISTRSREVLNQVFDFVFFLDEERNTAHLARADFARVFAFTLKPIAKCVFLSPAMLVLKNCDELFDHDIPCGLVCGGSTDHVDTSICLLRPSLEAFYAFMECKESGKDFDKYLADWLRNQDGEQDFLETKYRRKVTPGKEMLMGFDEDIRIVTFLESPNELAKRASDVDALGVLGKLVLSHWMNISAQVAPLLENGLSKASLSTDPYEHAPEPIAIVGMSCRYPGSNSVDEFWELLANAGDGTGEPPPFRWTKGSCNTSRVRSRDVNAGFLKIPVDEFDSKFFGISPKEMVTLDPQHRLLLQLMWEALEDAAIDPQSIRGSHSGVFTGPWLTNYQDILSNADYEFFRTYMGNSMGAAAARISFHLGLTGPSIATESGCSSSIVAVHLACKSLLNGESKLALVGGVNLILHPFGKGEMSVLLSPDGHCKTFDSAADGFARAEGCGVLVLKRLSDAVKDSDNIWALIRGSAIAQEGTSKSMGTPTVACEALAMSQALKEAHVRPEEVSYIEAHGTGTPVGDPMEVAAIAKAYHSAKREEPLILGSVKTNVGHTESCSGITGIMKVVLAMQNEVIPAHRNFTTLNPAINLDAVPAKLPLEPIPWGKIPGKSRIAGVSSFGITGTDAHVIVEEPPSPPQNKKILSMGCERSHHLLRVAAKTEDALQTILDKYEEHLATRDDHFEDVAYSANIGRAASTSFAWRAAIVAKSREDALANISKQKFLRGELDGSKVGKVCFLFTGQGSQYAGMGKQLYDTSPIFRMHFDYCEQLLKNKYRLSIKDVLWSTNNSPEISRTIYSQTSIFCFEYALLKLWESWGVKPDFALGHSLGEFAAAVCAGIVSVEDAIDLVAERSRLIDELPPGKMLVIRADEEKVEASMRKFAMGDPNKILDYAAINSKDQTVVAGNSDVVLEFGQFCKEAGLKCVVLEATHAFHSRHMDPMLEKYRDVASRVERHTSADGCKYISGVKGALVDGASVDEGYWVEHTRQKVEFMKASKAAVELGCTIFVEVGPQPVLSALTMANNSEASLTCLPSAKRTEREEWVTLLNTLSKLYVSGVDVDWKGFDQFYERKKVRLPPYPFSGKKFWPDLTSLSGVAPIHPLLGRVISNASPSKLFQCGLSLNAAEYIKDHVLGTRVIFPGAGYLEMCLAAGLAAVEGSVDTLNRPSRPVKVEDLTIKAPFCFYDSETVYQLQTTAEFVDTSDSGSWNHINVQIYQQWVDSTSTNSNNKWLRHALATFSPVVSAEDTAAAIDFDVDAFLDTISSPTAEDFGSGYDELATMGLVFGPVFRSLEKIWRDEEGKKLVAKVRRPESSSSDNYIVHPVLLDAMLQALAVLKVREEGMKRKLHVPIKVGKYVWFSEPGSGQLYVHAVAESGSSTSTVLLIDADGKVVAMLSSVELIDTTLKQVELALLEQQATELPEMWEEDWRLTPSPSQHRLELREEICRSVTRFSSSTDSTVEQQPEGQSQLLERLNEIVKWSILLGLYECGWTPVVDQVFEEETLFERLQIQREFRQLFGFYMEVIEGMAIIKKEADERWRIVAHPPPESVLKEALNSAELTTDLTSSGFKSAALFHRLGKGLCPILQGKELANNVLFPSDTAASDDLTLTDFYYDYFQQLCFVSTKDVLKALKHLKESQRGGSKRVIRVLEIGAGTGAFSAHLIEGLEALDMEYEYTYTDISPFFFTGAAKKFESSLKRIQFRKLNIEEDPLSQGFIPEYFDICAAGEVIHATRDIRQSMCNLRMLMAPFGIVYLSETTAFTPYLTFLVGFFDGYWRFTDTHLRRTRCTLSEEQWRSTVLPSAGFTVDGVTSCGNSNHSLFGLVRTRDNHLQVSPAPQIPAVSWILYHFEDSPVSSKLREKLEECTGRRIILVQPGPCFEASKNSGEFKVRMATEQDFQSMYQAVGESSTVVEGILYCWALDTSKTSQEDILRPYFYAVKNMDLLGQKSSPKLMTITNGGIAPIEGNHPHHFRCSTLWGFTRTLSNERTDLVCRCIDLHPDLENGGETAFSEIWLERNNEVLVGYDGSGSRYAPQLQRYKPARTELKIPAGSDRYQVILPQTKSIGDIQFGPLDACLLGENEVEVEIQACALNFRDLFAVLKPTPAFKDINILGFDIAGIVKRLGCKVSKWQVGDAVFGVRKGNIAFASHANLSENEVAPVPPKMTLFEAATLPTGLMTAYECLIQIGKLRPGDTALIHTASGGVGLMAVQICQRLGAEVIATAGSKRKQSYLRSLGIQHVFHSRNKDYGREILRVTRGRGVDVVLNSLTSEGFKEATLSACAPGARFVEMSKLSVWQPDQVKQLRPDVEYTIFDLETADDSVHTRLHDVLQECAQEEGSLSPIPHVLFDGVHIREALTYLQKGKHIGKIVCSMPQVRRQLNGEFKVATPLFSERSTYLITGGLGGIGFAVCEWMLENGAKHIVLAGRKVPSPAKKEAVSGLNANGANVVTVQLDVGNFEECSELLRVVIPGMKLPPLRGVMHAAGTLADGFIENQDWARLSLTFKSKIDGTLHLHELTKDSRLEHFVLFSSMVALFGSPGQSNHAAGSLFEDTFAHYRHSVGLPATVVNWGQWGEVGIAVDFDIAGLNGMSTSQGLAALEHAMKSHQTQTGTLNVDSLSLFLALLPRCSNYFDEGVRASASLPSSSSQSITIKSDEFWEKFRQLDDSQTKLAYLQGELKRIVRFVLKMDAEDTIHLDANIQDLGVDSLMVLEVKNYVQAMLGDGLPISVDDVRDCNTVSMLSARLIQLIEGDQMKEQKRATLAQVNALIRSDSASLPDDVLGKGRDEGGVTPLHNVSTVLLTGSTGNLGSHVLRELTNMSQIAQVICIMKPTHDGRLVEHKLRQVLESRELLADLDMSKVRCIEGNVVEEHFGMAKGTWEKLTLDVEAVVHCAAKKDSLEEFMETGRNNDVRSVNVGGTRNILKFASEGKLKHVYHASTLLAATRVRQEDGSLSEVWPETGDFDGRTTLAYPISKFVGELLIKEAAKRGLPCKLFRFPDFIGNSQTGRFELTNSHIILRVLSVLKGGVQPENMAALEVLPVDICAQVSLRLFFSDSAPSDVYHISHHQPDMEQDFPEKVASDLGHKKLGTATIANFVQRCKELSSQEASPSEGFSGVAGFEGKRLLQTIPKASEKVLRYMPDFYQKLRPTMDYILQDIEFAMNEGWFEKMGF